MIQEGLLKEAFEIGSVFPDKAKGKKRHPGEPPFQPTFFSQKPDIPNHHKLFNKRDLKSYTDATAKSENV